MFLERNGTVPSCVDGQGAKRQIRDMHHSSGDTLVTPLDKSPEDLRDLRFQAVIARTPAAFELFCTGRTPRIRL